MLPKWERHFKEQARYMEQEEIVETLSKQAYECECYQIILPSIQLNYTAMSAKC